MNQKGFANIIILIIAVIAIVGISGYFVFNRQALLPKSILTSNSIDDQNTFPTPIPIPTPKPSPVSNPIACSMIAKICPDGSSVGRVGPKCEFAKCPTTPTSTPNGEKIIRKVGEQESSFLIQKINFNSVDGLFYRMYPVATNVGEPITLHIGDDVGYSCEGVSDRLISIDFSDQKIIFTKISGPRPNGGCPICLADKTLIDTPSGSIQVKDIKIGMQVWTTNKTGQRVYGIITKISKISVPPTHQMVHLVLSDKRELFASLGHPTIDGRNLGNLILGDLYDGASVISVQHVPYDEGATYDVLPSGETGFYWANGVLLGSTLYYN